MKIFRFSLFLAVFFTSTSFCALTVTLFCSGKFINTDKHFPAAFKGLTLFVNGDGKYAASCVIDSTNHYEIFFTDYDQRRFDFYVTNQRDTLLLQPVSLTEEDNYADFIFPRTYLLKNGKILCPICHESDQTIQIVYGEGVEKKDVIAGGCMRDIISPNWYCSRDKVKF